MADINLSADLAQAIRQLQQLHNVQGQVVNDFKDLTKATVSFNNQGDKTTATVTTQVSANQKLVATLRMVDGEWRVVSSTIQEIGTHTQRLVQVQKQLAEALIMKKQATGLKDIEGLIRRIASTAGNLAIYRSFNLITQALQDSTRAAREYQVQISLIRTISQDSQLTNQQWADQLKQVSNELGISFKDVASAAYDAVSNQVTQGSQVGSFLMEIGNFAKTTNSTLKDSQNLVASVLNTYGEEAGSVEEISAKLFKTIDRGRIVTSDLSDTFGRSAFIARDLGVEFEEVLAVLATLTRQGVTTDDAVTLLNNGMQKLTKPTEKLQALLNSLGYTSGRSAIQVTDLRTVFEQLIDAVKRGEIDSTEIFNEQRSERFFAAFSLSKDKYLEDLDQIKNKSLDTFRNAIGIRNESPAEQLNKELVKFENALATSFGDNFNRNLLNVVNGLKSIPPTINEISNTVGLGPLVDETVTLEQAANKTFQVLQSGLITVGTLVTLYKGMAFASGLVTASQNRATVASLAEKVAQASKNATLKEQIDLETKLALVKQGGVGLGRTLNIATLVATAVVAYSAYEASAVEAFENSGRAVDELGKRLRETQVEKQLDKDIEKVNKLKDAFNDLSKDIGKALSSGLAKTNLQLGDITEKLRRSSETARGSFTGALDLIGQKTSTIKKEFDAIPERIRQAAQSARDFEGTLRSTLQSTLTKYADPQQTLRIYDREIQRLQQVARDGFNRGDDQSVSEARKAFDEISRLQAQRAEKGFEIEKDAYSRYLESIGAQGEFKLTFDERPLLQQQNDLLRERQALEANLIKQLEKKKATQAETLAAQKKVEDDAKQAVQDFENFDVLTPGGDVKEKYKTPTGQVDVSKITQEYNDLTAKIRNIIPSADVTGQLSFGKEAKARLDLIKEQVEVVTRQQDLKKVQEEQLRVQKDVNAEFQKGIEARKAYANSSLELTTALKTEVTALRDAAAAAENKVRDVKITGANEGETSLGGRVVNRVGSRIGRFFTETLPRNLPDTLPGGFENNVGQDLRAQSEKYKLTVEAANAVLAEIADLSREENKVLVNGVKVIDPARLKGVLDRAKELPKSIQDAIQLQLRNEEIGGVNAAGFRVGDGTLLDRAKDISELDKQLKEITGKLDEAGRSQERFKKALSTDQSLQKALDGFKGYSDTAKDGILSNAEALRKQGTAIDELLNKVRAAQAELEQMRVQPGLEGLLGGAAAGTVERRAYGGPIGSDNRMSWLTDGEYVLNRGASRKFYSQIVTMNNAGRQPNYFSGGGEVTNISGTSINVNGAGNVDAVANAVLHKMARMKRTGR